MLRSLTLSASITKPKDNNKEIQTDLFVGTENISKRNKSLSKLICKQAIIAFALMM